MGIIEGWSGCQNGVYERGEVVTAIGINGGQRRRKRRWIWWRWLWTERGEEGRKRGGREERGRKVK
jgi:hypothetical protein